MIIFIVPSHFKIRLNAVKGSHHLYHSTVFAFLQNVSTDIRVKRDHLPEHAMEFAQK
jgi:hypothetical protein